MYASSCARRRLALAAKNGLCVDVLEALERNRDLAELRHVPANRSRRSCSRSHLRAIAPAADAHGAVTRADGAPPPRGSRMPYLCQ